MLSNPLALDQVFGQTFNPITQLRSATRLPSVPLLHALKGVPILAVALNEQVEPGNVEVKHVALGDPELSFYVNALRCKYFSYLALNRSFLCASTVTAERTKTPARFSDRRDDHEAHATRLAVSNYGRLTGAFERAKVIAICVRDRNRKYLQTFRACLFHCSITTPARAIDTRLAAALIERKEPSTFPTREWRVAVPYPSTLDRARATVSTQEVSRRRSLRFYLSAGKTVGVSVFITHDAYATVVSRLDRAVGVFAHLSGSPILT